MLNAILWWLLVFEKGKTPLDWLHLVPHSVLPWTITFDGLNVNRIPMRWQHYWGFVVPMECLFVFWTYLQNDVFEVENPELPKNTTDHYIYEDYNWKEDSTDPLVYSAIGIFAFGPPIYFIEWMFSQYWLFCCCLGDRRYYYTDPRVNRPKRSKLEGAGLAGMSSVRRMSFDEDEESYSSGFDSQDEETKEEEKVEDEPMDNPQPKRKYRSKLEELAYSS